TGGAGSHAVAAEQGQEEGLQVAAGAGGAEAAGGAAGGDGAARHPRQRARPRRRHPRRHVLPPHPRPGAALQHLRHGGGRLQAGGGDGRPALPAHPGAQRAAPRRVPRQRQAAAPPPLLPPPRRQTRPRIRRTPARLLPLPPQPQQSGEGRAPEAAQAVLREGPRRRREPEPPVGGDIVRCMRNIFISLSDSCREASRAANPSAAGEGQRAGPSPSGIAAFWSLSEPSSISSWVQSPQVDLNQNNNLLASETVFDPYKAREKLSWADIGGYGAASEVSWMSAGKKQLEYAAESLRKFRLLIEQLAEVNPVHLSDDARLAFWINLYNALLMHAYLAYGVPRSDMKLFSLMQKAAYTIGGNSFSAAFIEYVILKMKPPNHRPQMALLLALQKIKSPEDQRKFCISTPEPLLTFALSCGMYSSPAVKIYTASNVREELQDAQRDFIRASVGVSRKGKLLIPKMLHCFARGFVDDNSFPIWISHFLPQQQATFVEHCVSHRGGKASWAPGLSASSRSTLGSDTFSCLIWDH
uniref:DUF547 domain-containing protein n=1 Tax=Aegilops tauschii subsp. strangulata TaxID=200361 RepID=A0A453SNM6_AEGTS